jgi:hypothetical protein
MMFLYPWNLRDSLAHKPSDHSSKIRISGQATNIAESYAARWP